LRGRGPTSKGDGREGMGKGKEGYGKGRREGEGGKERGGRERERRAGRGEEGGLAMYAFPIIKKNCHYTAGWRDYFFGCQQ